MNERSPNFPSPRLSSGTPTRSQHYNHGGTPNRNHQFGLRQPLYLQPHSPHLSPRGNRLSSPRNNSSSPDFIPLGISSPVGRAKHNWSQQNRSYSSSYSSFSSTPPSSNSSHNFSPYKRQGFRGNFRGRGKFKNWNNSGDNSPHISLYVDKECLQDPWAELEQKLKHLQTPSSACQNDYEETHESAVCVESESEESGSDDT